MRSADLRNVRYSIAISAGPELRPMLALPNNAGTGIAEGEGEAGSCACLTSDSDAKGLQDHLADCYYLALT